MSLAWTRRVALGGVVLASTALTSSACRSGSSGGAAPNALADAGDTGSGAGGTAIVLDPPAAQLCGNGSDVCAGPSIDVLIGVDGPAEITLGLEGDYRDATLSADDLPLANGHADVTLHTASTATTFRLAARLASDPTQTTSIAVVVGATGFATVRAVPSYAGQRWTTQSKMYAVATTRGNCNALASAPLSDSEPWTTAPRNIPVLLPVPAGTPLAVDVRVGHYAYGCADVPPMAASTTSHDVPVDVYDLPIALSATNLDATFSFSTDATMTSAWQSALASAVQRVSGGFYASGNEGPALLDGVRATIGSSSDQAQFDQLRTQQGWDTKTTTWLSARTPSMHDRAAAWLGGAKTAALGPLGLHVAAGTTAQTAAITASMFGPLSATSAAIAPPAPFAWSADGDDTVHLSGAVDFATGPFVAHVADGAATAAVAQATDVPSALALAIDAAGLAQSLVGSGVSYGSCVASCTADAFRTAIASAWSAAWAPLASGGDDAHLTLTASAPATVGDHAEPLGFAGAWIGQASGAGVPTSFALKGQVAAQQPSTVH